MLHIEQSRVKYRDLNGVIKIKEFSDPIAQQMWIEDQEEAFIHNRPDAELDEVISQQHKGFMAKDYQSQLPENKIPFFLNGGY